MLLFSNLFIDVASQTSLPQTDLQLVVSLIILAVILVFLWFYVPQEEENKLSTPEAYVPPPAPLEKHILVPSPVSVSSNSSVSTVSQSNPSPQKNTNAPKNTAPSHSASAQKKKQHQKKKKKK